MFDFERCKKKIFVVVNVFFWLYEFEYFNEYID